MQLICPHCQQKLEFAGPRPKYCSNCGQPIPDVAAPAEEYVAPGVATVAIQPTTVETPQRGKPEVAVLTAVPETVGPYRLIRRLGEGGMGTVYEAADPSGSRVALKLIRPEYATSPKAIERFRREGELTSKLAHPRCVFVLAADEDQGRPYIVMELMTGTTLNDNVREKGPLPPEEALAKILDVIEGLQEAHRLGLVHRDVKPSNCFVEADGRVKIGDFGLSKSLLEPAQLTRTGTFVGTPLYAAPEQIKKETVDAQSDVYSVAATLYFLLTGRAPFQSGDATATMARIVSEDPPPMRTLRPQLPKSLDKVVLRGLERDRKQRWRSMDEFHLALLSLLPAEPSVGGLGLRFVAYLLDCFLLLAAAHGFVLTWGTLFGWGFPEPVARELIVNTFALAYFGVLEGMWGQSLGKRILRLRVGTTVNNMVPGLGPALLRAGTLRALLGYDVFYVFLAYFMLGFVPEGFQDGAAAAQQFRNEYLRILLCVYVAMLFGVGLVLCTMRKGNGYRGLHEFLSGTRTYRLHWPQVNKSQAADVPDFRPEVVEPDGLPAQVGPYRVRGALHWGPQEQTLLADDVQLMRPVWLWLRGEGEPPLSQMRRSANRPTRLRWLACGTWSDRQWDAFLAPSGCPLPNLVSKGRRCTWAEFRGILDELTEELDISLAEGTLPSALAPEQLWVDPSGHAQLAEAPFGSDAPETMANAGECAGDEQRALVLLSDVASLGLEGTRRVAGTAPSPVHAPLPLHAAALLRRLVPGSHGSLPVRFGKSPEAEKPFDEAQTPYDRVGEVRAALLATRAESVEVTHSMRVKHLLEQCLVAAGGLFGVFMPVSIVLILAKAPAGRGPLTKTEAIAIMVSAVALTLLFFLLSSFFTRGGFSFVWAGIALVRSDGRHAERLTCFCRALLVVSFLAILGVFGLLGIVLATQVPWLGLSVLTLLAGVVAVYVALIMWNPCRAPHDYLAGTYLVPK